ncbi:MAG: LuxR C-terminal-related transcriptional regulator [Bacteroidales bacterium]
MAENKDMNEKRPGAESWEKLFSETLGKSQRVPFKGDVKIESQVLELFDHSNRCFFLADYSSLRMLFVSPNIVNVLGYTPGEFDFRKLFGIIHPDDSKAVFEIGKMVLSRELNYIAGGSNRHIALYMAYRAAKSSGKYTRISLTISRHTDLAGGIYDMAEIRDISHVRCGTVVTFALLGGKPLKELPQESREGLSISRREQEIIYYISQGYTSRKIAYELNISEYTVNTHRKNIMRKTGTTNLVDMLLFAATNGII